MVPRFPAAVIAMSNWRALFQDLGTPPTKGPLTSPEPTTRSVGAMDSTEPDPTTPEATSEEEADGLCAEISSSELKEAIGKGVMKLGLKLMEKLSTGPEQPNVIISPLSLSLALAQLALGKVQCQWASVLHVIL